MGKLTLCTICFPVKPKRTISSVKYGQNSRQSIIEFAGVPLQWMKVRIQAVSKSRHYQVRELGFNV